MAVPANTQQTYQSVGNREDLINAIENIAPTETPFRSGIKKTDASATFHEWQTQDLAAAANNAQVEGDTFASAALVPTVRLGNRTQISSKAFGVSGTQEAVKSAGRGSEIGYQGALKAAELKRDQEIALCQNTTAVTGTAGVARQLRGLEGWIATNNSLGAGGAAPNYGTNTAPTDGTARAFTEALLKDVLQQIWTQGGNPDRIMLGASATQTFSTFTGNATRMDKAEDGKVYASTKVYVSDFGEIEVMPNRFQRARTAFVLEMSKWKLAVLRDFDKIDRPKSADAIEKALITEYTLEALQEKASGAVRDIL